VNILWTIDGDCWHLLLVITVKKYSFIFYGILVVDFGDGNGYLMIDFGEEE